MQKLPVFLTRVPAGFPTPNEGEVEEKIDLNEHLIEHPAATFFVRVEGRSMEDAGIFEGDLLIVDRARQPNDGDIVLAVLNGEFTVKRLKKDGRVWLVAENAQFDPIEVTHECEFEVWGVVTYAVRKCMR